MKPIWIVDDDQSIRFVLEKALLRESLPTRSFINAQEVLAALNDCGDDMGPQVLVSDIRMPGGSGLDLLEKVKKKLPGLPVIISDQTPWKDLQNQQIGWDLPLDQPAAFAEAIARAAMMRQAQYAQWSAQAQAFAQDFVEKAGLEAAYLRLFS